MAGETRSRRVSNLGRAEEAAVDGDDVDVVSSAGKDADALRLKSEKGQGRRGGRLGDVAQGAATRAGAVRPARPFWAVRTVWATRGPVLRRSRRRVRHCFLGAVLATRRRNAGRGACFIRTGAGLLRSMLDVKQRGKGDIGVCVGGKERHHAQPGHQTQPLARHEKQVSPWRTPPSPYIRAG